MMPFYDVDAKLLFAAGKGECSLSILEFVDGTECITQASHTVLPEQSKGMGMLPKLAVDVMACEVDRLIQLCARQIVPVKIEVPRKSHRDFASDLYPDTDSDEVTLSAADWFSGKDGQVRVRVKITLKTSLDPSRRKSFSNPTQQPKPASAGEAPSSIPEQPGKVVQNDSITPSSGFKKVETEKKKVEPELPKPSGRAFTVGQKSKFRHWIATTLHPATHVTNIPKLKMSLPGSCDGFHANHERAAVPLTTPGGHIAILELSKVGRLPTTSPPSVQNTSAITDMRWDPFNPLRLAVGLENAAIKVWDIPKGGLKEVASDASFSLSGHHNKIICLQFHPLASGILASASTDSTIIIWDLDTQEKCITLSGHEDEILHFAWSSDGKYIASMCKDSKIRIFELRISTDPIKVTTGPEGSRGGRIAWTCGDQMLLTSGFSKNGNRQIAVYNVAHFDGGKIEDIELGASPSTLVPFYDEDSNVCFATGKGDTTVYSFEVSTEDPYLTGLNTFTNDQPHQSFSFLPKQNCDPRKVEFARAWCLKKTSLEPVSFKVPRVKMEYFQDDIFPDTRDLTKPSMTSQQWLDGDNKQATRISLRPSDMKPLSEAPKEAPKTKKYESYNAETYKTDEEKKEELLSAMSNKLDLDKELEQDTMEGVDEEEW
uniref:Coronin n=1 Tax=Ciona savignyi TaxID=51511 RepID=H2ZK42_CIOSA